MLGHPLPVNPSLEQLRKQAKELRDLVRTGRLDAIKMARELHPRWADASPTSTEWAGFTLAGAQLVLARSYGFASWRRLREHVELVARYRRSPQRRPAGGADLVDEFLRLACLTCYPSSRAGVGEEADDPRRQAEARQLLAAHPQLASATIHTAAAVGDIAAARSLVAADESLANQEGGPHRWPPLLYLTFSRLNSAEADHSTLEVARLLLAHGADPNAGYLPDNEPFPVTALSGAFHGERDPVNQPAHQHSLPLARLLLDAGADPNDEQALRNACGYYPFDDTGLALLLEHGLGRRSSEPSWWAQFRADLFGYQPPTPAQLVQGELRYAAMWNLPNRVRLLLRRCAEAGIDINAPAGTPDACQTAYELAVVGGNTEIVDLLTQAGAQTPPLDPIHQLIVACQRADRPAVHRLLAADTGLAQRAINTPWYPEPLAQAVAFNRPEAVALLVWLGFPINDRQRSPLHLAAMVGHLNIVQLLVELGADPTAEAGDNTSPRPSDRTPLGFARYNHQHEVVAYLTRLTSAEPNPQPSSTT
jgi:ankyrin repeat protein